MVATVRVDFSLGVGITELIAKDPLIPLVRRLVRSTEQERERVSKILYNNNGVKKITYSASQCTGVLPTNIFHFNIFFNGRFSFYRGRYFMLDRLTA